MNGRAASACVVLLLLPTNTFANQIDGTNFLAALIKNEIREGEKECRKTMRNTASCRIKIQKVLVRKKSVDTAKIQVTTNLNIKARLLIKASADAEIKTNAIYRMRSCEINITNVNKKIVKLSGAAKLLKPFTKSIQDIKIPTGIRQIKSNSTRNRADSFLEKRLKLVSKETARNCEQ